MNALTENRHYTIADYMHRNFNFIQIWSYDKLSTNIQKFKLSVYQGTGIYNGLGLSSGSSASAQSFGQSGLTGGVSGSTANAQSFGQTGQTIYPGNLGYAAGMYPYAALTNMKSGTSSSAQSSTVGQGGGSVSTAQAQSNSVSGLLGF